MLDLYAFLHLKEKTVNVISWLDTDIIIIRSTVPVGFTNRMADVYKKKVVFQPEYYGETIVHPFANIRN